MRLPVVIVMQAAQYGARADLSTPRLPSPSHWMTWNPLPNALVWPGVIEVHLDDDDGGSSVEVEHG